MTPERVTVRSYQVGFGDCFLFSVHYDTGDARHVLIDFGSTGRAEGTPSSQMKNIAKDIRGFTGGKLTAVVATHRHKDHISGFITNKNKSGTGDIIRSLEPELVIQPWTEDPELEESAVAPTSGSGQSLSSGAKARVRTLSAMQDVAGQIWTEVKRNRSLQPELKNALGFLGENNVKNLNAVQNLMTMSGDRSRNRYVYFGQPSGLEDLIPGITVDVLGPPTVEQHAEVQSQTSWNPDEFWLRLEAAGRVLPVEGGNKVGSLFPERVIKRDNYRFPINSRWFIKRSRQLRAEQMMRIVAMLDDALNNTSVILLFRIGGKSFLFPGDAQLENWQYALSKPEVQELLRDVDVYKVGHHGSRNATPKSLWDLFAHRSDKKTAPDRLHTLMSTMAGKHGSKENNSEVPRSTLVQSLERESDHHSTQSIPVNELFHELVVHL